jgi:hypothetical protein
MSDLPASELGYPAVVVEYFLALRGAGLLVSPLDEELVRDWERRGLPVAVVCEGLREGMAAARARGGPLPRSLRALRLAVEDGWRAYRAGRVGDAPAPPDEAGAAAGRLASARALLAEAGRGARPAVRDAYRAAWRALGAGALDAGAGSPLAQVDAALRCADDRLLAGWLASLPAAERRALGPLLRSAAGPRHRGESRRAHRETLRVHLLDAARRAGLTVLRGSV